MPVDCIVLFPVRSLIDIATTQKRRMCKLSVNISEKYHRPINVHMMNQHMLGFYKTELYSYIYTAANDNDF